MPSLQAKCDFLRAQSLRAIETHYAWVFLTRRLVYKLKKPSRQWPLDYRTLEQRRRGCREELTLNRALAPGVYQAVVPLVQRPDGALRIGGRGRPVEWLLVMKRLPATHMLDRAIVDGTVPAQALLKLARKLQRFHAQAVRRPLAASAYLRLLAGRIRANQRALTHPDLQLDRRQVNALARLQTRALARLGAQIGARGRLRREVHGDLRPEHICLWAPLCVIDALEFDVQLRTFDPLEELAYLALECQLLGGGQVARRLLQHYARSSGEPIDARLLEFYVSCRAATRAKLMGWRVLESRGEEQRHFRRRARQYLAVARRAARRAWSAR